MNPIENRIPILIQGASGHMGQHLVMNALMNSRLKVNVMMRDPSEMSDMVKRVEAAGGRVMKCDLSDRECLRDSTKGMHTVICTISACDDKACIEGQMALIDDCMKTGVKVFVPSIFGMNNEMLDRDEMMACPMTAFKVKIDDYLKSVKLPTLKIHVGIMMEQMMDVLRETQCYWGDEDLKHDLTSFENAARLTVEAVARKNVTGKIIYRGGSYTIKEIQDTYNKVRGSNVQWKRAGSLDDLKKLIETKKSEGDMKMVSRLRLMAMIFDKRSNFTTTNNKDFEEVRATSLEEFLKENSSIVM